jgi:hypothetical protein
MFVCGKLTLKVDAMEKTETCTRAEIQSEASQMPRLS